MNNNSVDFSQLGQIQIGLWIRRIMVVTVFFSLCVVCVTKAFAQTGTLYIQGSNCKQPGNFYLPGVRPASFDCSRLTITKENPYERWETIQGSVSMVDPNTPSGHKVIINGIRSNVRDVICDRLTSPQGTGNLNMFLTQPGTIRAIAGSGCIRRR